MGLIEHVRVGQKSLEAGIRAKQDRPAAIFDLWLMRWISVAENPPAEGYESSLANPIFLGHCSQLGIMGNLSKLRTRHKWATCADGQVARALLKETINLLLQ